MGEPIYLPGMEHEERLPELSQWYTPPRLAQRLWDWTANSRMPFRRILEPAAGTGALIKPMLAGPHCPREVVAVDIDPRRVAQLRRELTALAIHNQTLVTVHEGDALELDLGRFDLVLQNPPYENDDDVEFILHSLEVAPRTVGIFRSVLVHGSREPRQADPGGRFERLWRWVDPKRIAWCAKRPHFGGDHSAAADFAAFDLVPRSKPRRAQEPFTCSVEWW